MIRFFLFIVGFVCLSSCGDKPIKMVDADVIKMEEILKQDSSKQNIVGLIGTIYRKAQEQKTAKDQELFYQYGAETCEKLGYLSEKRTFLSQLLKCCYRSEETPARLEELAGMLAKDGKTELASVINNALFKQFNKSPEAQRVNEADRKLDADKFIKSFGEAAFDATGSTGLKEKEAIKYIDLCEAKAMADPKDASSPDYLWKGAEMARTLGSIEKCVALYTALEEQFPTYEKAPDALFVKGYILETSYNDKVNAKLAYEKFIKNYPRHQLAKDAKFLLDNVDKSDDELLKLIPKEDQ